MIVHRHKEVFVSHSDNNPMPSIKSINAACKKIGYQFPKSPEGRLMFAVVELAIKDLRDPVERFGAQRYLAGDIVHAEACGVSSDWIRSVLDRCEVISDKSLDNAA